MNQALDLQRRTVRINGATIAYDVEGSGPAVVLISGGGTLDRRMWDGQVAALSRRHTLIRYDVRGIGGSSRPDAPFSHSEDLYSLVQLLGKTPAHIVGLSFGAAIAIDVALDHPEVVNSLVLAAPGVSSEKDENVKPALEAAAFARQHGLAALVDAMVTNRAVLATESPDVRERIKAIYLDNADAFTSDFALIRLWRPTVPPAGDRLSEIRAPTLVLVGDQDSAHVRATVEKFASEIAGARTLVIEGAGHLLNIDAPNEFNDAVLRFLASSC